MIECLRLPIPLLVKRVVNGYRRARAGACWARFLGQTDPALKRLVSALGEVHHSRLTEDEQRALDAIEQRRSALAANRLVIAYHDFGAGDAKHPRSAHESLAGVASRRCVADLVLASLPRAWGLLLFKLIRHFQPRHLVELGSAMGLSGAYQAAALRLNDLGHLYTLEGCRNLADFARETVSRIDGRRVTVVEGRFEDTLPGVLTGMGQVDFAFVDGHHDEAATLQYWGLIRERMVEGSVAVFDDCNWSEGMHRAWERISSDPTVSCAIDLGKFGLCVHRGLGTGRCLRTHRSGGTDRARRFRLPYPAT